MKTKQITVLGIIAVLIIAGVLVVTSLPDKKPTAKSKPVTKSVSLADPVLIVKDFNKYSGQEVSVTGKVVQDQNKAYYLTGQEAKPSAIKLDFSKSNIDPKTLIDGPTAEKEKFVSKPRVTVTGKVDISRKGAPAVIIVSSVK